MADGTTKPIKDVEVGDVVLASDLENGAHGPRVVTGVRIHYDLVVDLKLDGETITTTEDHPFWNATDQQWQQAQALDPGDRLLTATGAALTVDGLVWATAHIAPAYNFTVDDIHTYYVIAGNTPVLVHNCPDDVPFGPTMHYEPNPKHRGGTLGGRVGPANAQAMLDRSVLFNSASGRRIAYDREAGEIVVFARTQGAVYHGYVSTWAARPAGCAACAGSGRHIQIERQT